LLALYPPNQCHHLTPAQLAEPGTAFVVARIDGVAVGCGALRRMAGYGEIKRMYVRPAYRGQGISRHVLQRLEEEAARDRLRLLRLETGALSYAAIGLYEAAGYLRIAPFGEYTENGVSVCFEKRLA
jgi:putative acetyltransferase